MKMIELLKGPECWTQGANARRPDGSGTDSRDPEACQWCLIGAFVKCYGHTGTAESPEYQKLRDAIKEVIGYNESIICFNDLRAKSFDDIKKVLELAGV